MIKLSGVYHSYDALNWILKNLDYEFFNKKYVLIGPSGIGKSTLLHISGQILKSTLGIVEHQVKTAFVFQSLNLLSDFTVKENIEIAAKISNQKIEYEEIAKLIGIMDILDKFPNQISGGQKQKVAIIRELARGAKFFFADEPTGDLDSENAQIIRQLFDALNKELKIGFLISTHDSAWLDIADEKLQLIEGKLCQI